MKRTRCVPVAALVLSSLVLVAVVIAFACGTEEATTTTKAETTTTKAETATTTERLSTAEILLPNGNIQATGFIHEAWKEGGKRYIVIDYAELLTGQEANDAAGTEVEYYIKNDNPQEREFEVSDKVSIAHFSTDEPVAWDTFTSYWSDSPPPTDAEFPYDVAASLWWIERDGSLVVKIDQQYLP